MAVRRSRLFVIIGLVFASLFASHAFGGLVLVSRSSSLNYANNLGGVDDQKTSQTTNLGVYNNSISFNQSDAAGSHGSTLSHQSTDVEFSNGSIFSSGHVFAQAMASPVGSETMNLTATSKLSIAFDVVGHPEFLQMFATVDSSQSDRENISITFSSPHGGSDGGPGAGSFNEWAILSPDTYTMSISASANASAPQPSDSGSVWYTLKAGPALAIPLPPTWASGSALLAIAAAAHALRGRLRAGKGLSLFGIAVN